MNLITKLVFIFPMLFLKCECYYDTLYESIFNAQETLKDFGSSFHEGMKTLSHTIKFIEKFVDSTIEEDCIFECTDKNKVPVANLNHVPKVNGCGSFGIYLEKGNLPKPEMTECCNDHDRCYDTCGSNKEDCDKKFKRCIYGVCDIDKGKVNLLQHKMCQGGAKLLYTATLALGCAAFKESQNSSCLCKNIDSFKSEKYKNKYEGEL